MKQRTLTIIPILIAFQLIAAFIPPATAQEIDATLWKTLKGHSDCVRSVAFSPDGSVLASVSR